jgi:hypothetical protein
MSDSPLEPNRDLLGEQDHRYDHDWDPDVDGPDDEHEEVEDDG